MDKLSISHEEDESRGRYFVTVDGIEAELTYSRMGSTGNVIADHTGVPDALSGKGVGKALVTFMVEDARARGFRIVPLCPFVKAMFQRNPDWSDVMM